MMIDVKVPVSGSTKVLFDEPAAAAAPQRQAVVAVVKWFRADRGYGFIGLGDGQGDAFLHVKALRGLELDAAPAGATIRVELQEGPRGRQVARVLEVDPSTASIPQETAVEVTGKVKWFDEVRGFGFVASDDFGRDVFVHCSILGRLGVSRLTEGQAVTMRVVETVKGRQAIEVSI